jgi:mRNA interferase RelE/StbE
VSPEYAVKLTRTAVKEIGRLPPKIRSQIEGRLEALATHPRPHDAKRLVGRRRGYRLDAGEYRILYDIDDSGRVVAVWRVKHRKDVYRNL